MNYIIYLKAIFLIIIVFVLSAISTYATETQPFPSCLNPQGEIKASYPLGTHGIPGSAKSYIGSDIVYKLENGNALQCLCEVSGNATQTNWMKATGFSETKTSLYISSGWIYVPNGLAWGLEDAPYIAKNIAYSCVGGAEGNRNVSNLSSSNNSSSENSNSPGDSSENTGGNVPIIANIGQILGLASTGNIATIYALFLFGVLFILIGIIMLKHQRSNQSR